MLHGVQLASFFRAQPLCHLLVSGFCGSMDRLSTNFWLSLPSITTNQLIQSMLTFAAKGFLMIKPYVSAREWHTPQNSLLNFCHFPYVMNLSDVALPISPPQGFQITPLHCHGIWSQAHPAPLLLGYPHRLLQQNLGPALPQSHSIHATS